MHSSQNPTAKLSGNFLISTLAYSGLGDAMYAIRYFDFYRNHVPENQLKVIILIEKENVRGLLSAVKDFVDLTKVHLVAIDCKNTLRFSERDEKELPKKSILIVSSETGINSFPLYDRLVNQSQYLKNFLSRTEVFLNAAVPLANSANTPFKYIQKACKVFSLLELGGQGLENLKKDKDLLAKIEYRESALGFHAQSINRLFLYNSIKDYQTNNSTLTPEHFDNKTLARNIFPKEAETVLVIGYQQRQAASLFYYDVLALTFANKHIKIISNTSYLTPEAIKKSVALSRASKVIVCDNQGNEKLTVSNEHADNKTVIHVYDFSDISNKDKQMYLALADVSFGSGDNSYMEGLSAGALCLWDVPQWKILFVKRMQHLAKDKKLTSLENYYEKLYKIATEVGFEYLSLDDISHFSRFIKDNYEKLRSEFSILKDLLFQEYNLTDILIPMLTDNTKFIIQEPTMEEVMELFKLLPIASKFNKDFLALIKIRSSVLTILKKDNAAQLRELTTNHPYLQLDKIEFNAESKANIFQEAVISNAVRCWDVIFLHTQISPAKACAKLVSNLPSFNNPTQQKLFHKINEILADQPSKDIKKIMDEFGMDYNAVMLNAVLKIKLAKGADDWRELYNEFKGQFSNDVEISARHYAAIKAQVKTQLRDTKAGTAPRFFSGGDIAIKKIIMPNDATLIVQQEIDALKLVVRK